MLVYKFTNKFKDAYLLFVYISKSITLLWSMNKTLKIPKE